MVLGLTIFPAHTLLLALLLAAVPYCASRILPDRSRTVIQLLVPIILIAFPCVTAFGFRASLLGIVLVTAATIEASAWRTGRGPSPWALVIGSAIIAGTLWCFRFQIIYWYVVVDLVPAARALRVVSRGLLLGLIPAALGLACFFDQTRTRPKHIVAACALGLACLLEQGVTTPSESKSAWRATASEVARRVDRGCTSFYYSPHSPELEINEYHLDAMWAEIETGVPTINGYSGHCPPGWLPLYYSPIYGETDINRIEPALRQWAARNQLEPERICWIGGRNEAIVRSPTPAHASPLSTRSMDGDSPSK